MVSLDPKLQEYNNSFATRNVGGISPSFGSLTVGGTHRTEGGAGSLNLAQYDNLEISPVVDAPGVNEATRDIAARFGRDDGRLLA